MNQLQTLKIDFVIIIVFVIRIAHGWDWAHDILDLNEFISCGFVTIIWPAFQRFGEI